MDFELDKRCPCGTGLTYGECCYRFHSGEWVAPTAEALMRSRFTAFAVGNSQYLLDTWDPETRPSELGLDMGIDFYRLDNLQEALDLGAEDYFWSGHPCLVEWPDLVDSLLPPEKTLDVYLQEDPLTGVRSLSFLK